MAAKVPAASYPHTQRREFFIVSELNDKVLDIKMADTSAGTDVVMYKMKHPPAKNQLWYLDQSGCIRSALNDMVFHNPTKGGVLQMQVATADPRSQWRLNGAHIVNGAGEVLDIKGGSKSDGASLCAYENKNNPNQRWRFKREFVLISDLNNRVIEVQKGQKEAGAKVVMATRTAPPTLQQLWYCDNQGFIRSALNDLVFYNATKGGELKMSAISADPRSQWKFETVTGNKIINGEKEALEIRGASDVEGAELCSCDYKKAKNQHWSHELV